MTLTLPVQTGKKYWTQRGVVQIGYIHKHIGLAEILSTEFYFVGCVDIETGMCYDSFVDSLMGDV